MNAAELPAHELRELQLGCRFELAVDPTDSRFVVVTFRLPIAGQEMPDERVVDTGDDAIASLEQFADQFLRLMAKKVG